MNLVQQHGGRGVKGALPLTAEQFEQVSRSIGSIVARYARAGVGDFDDARQEAWVAAMSAIERWDPAKGGSLGGHVWRCARTHVAEVMARMQCPVTLSRGATLAGAGRAIHAVRMSDPRRAESDGARQALEAEMAAAGSVTESPEEAMLRGALLARAEASPARRRAAYRRALAQLKGPARALAEAYAARLWLGLPVPGPTALAEEFETTKGTAAKALRRVREALRCDPEVAEDLNAADEEEEIAK